MNSGLFYGIFTGIWLCYTVMWVINTWLLNKPHSKPLHRVITFFLIFKCIYLICTCLSMFSCKANKACYWDMATTSTYTIYNTFLLTNLLLISKGFNIIREYLDRSELTFMAIMMGGIYLSFSAYTINKSKLILILLIVLCILTYFYLNFTNLNIRKLENRLE